MPLRRPNGYDATFNDKTPRKRLQASSISSVALGTRLLGERRATRCPASSRLSTTPENAYTWRRKLPGSERILNHLVAKQSTMTEPIQPPTAAVTTEKLTRWFGDQCAVDNVDLRVEAGTFYGFLGPNGAGKSTTIKMLTGLMQPSAGSIRVLGKNPLDPSEAIEVKRQIGVVPDKLALFEYLTAVDYLTFIGRVFHLERQTLRERIQELLELMQLDRELNKLAKDYSHGMRKKLALAAALLPNPKLLFLDEPFEGVDVVASSMIRAVLLGFVERGGTVFLTSHILEIVERICTHVGIIAGGKLIEQMSLAEMRAGGTLEGRFLEKLGFQPESTARLNWLETTKQP